MTAADLAARTHAKLRADGVWWDGRCPAHDDRKASLSFRDDVWRATFSRSASLAHDGFGAGPTPWKAVQLAAWSALARETTRAR
jgi:hypothetical protein